MNQTNLSEYKKEEAPEIITAPVDLNCQKECTSCRHYEEDPLKKQRIKKKYPCTHCYFVQVRSKWERK